MSRLRAAFMGSPAFAVPSLHAVHRRCDLRLVVCQPDRPAGRGRKLTPPAVKQAALELGLAADRIDQPKKMRDGRLAARLRELELDVIVVVAFGRILPPDVLAAARHGCINVHASRLPRWRGAAPIQRAVLAGDRETAVAIMRMDEGLDTGPVYRMIDTPIGPLETSGQLFERLAELGAEALDEFLAAFPDVPSPIAQPAEGITHAAMLRKDEGRVDWERSAAALVDHVRGMDPWPVAFCVRDGDPLKLFDARPSTHPRGEHGPGTVVAVDDDGVHVAALDGVVCIAVVQPAGKRRMPAAAWAAGRRIQPGVPLG
ncbi:methionyl-tRNA formyltransferase [Paraliomyxa miuraensis]|uniref:methionyl-tRNA formyltransferase n=1 Tax=Paraliomyxa miuraensis TaxID=376150 RepID=UPI00225763AF|nr:methionyl-tRNA formyltransferase [Paraliomyxa miuraensis]MCX4241313.1 methionyl-tRNA formyltransferase [Paraliomyxa miuraensis]